MLCCVDTAWLSSTINRPESSFHIQTHPWKTTNIMYVTMSDNVINIHHGI